jgi:hypothetical protein
MVMMNGRLANQHDVKIASRCRTIFGKQLRLLWSKRARFSPGKRSKQVELRSDPSQKSVRLDRSLFEAVWNTLKIKQEHKVKLLSKLIETAVRFGLP